MVEHVIEICGDMKVETIYGIMLPDNQRAINLMKKIGCTIKYLNNSTIKGILDLTEAEAKKT